jgi:hypothetical protein
MSYHPIEPNYSQSLSEWFSSLYDYGYGGEPGAYDMTPEELLDQWGMPKIPGSEGYEMYEGILPTYPGFKEQYGIQNYLLNLEKMSQATESARGKLGRELALTGEDTTGGFYRAGAEEGQKLQKRETIADIMKDVIEQENIGKTGAEWDLAGKVIGERKDWERDVSTAYQRYLQTVIDPPEPVEGPPGGGGEFVPEFGSLEEAAEAYDAGDLSFNGWQMHFTYFGVPGDAPIDVTEYLFGSQTCHDPEANNYGDIGNCSYGLPGDYDWQSCFGCSRNVYTGNCESSQGACPPGCC